MHLVGPGVEPTLMSMFPTKIRTAIAAGVVLVQLSLLPATYVLHLGCEHSGCSHARTSGSCAHSDTCPFHNHHSDESHGEDEKPHDSDQCRVCQTAFAFSIASQESAELTCSGNVELLSDRCTDFLDSADPYRHFSRGPPAPCVTFSRRTLHTAATMIAALCA